MATEMTREWVHEWNDIIYRNKDGTSSGPGIQGADFWDAFGIKSWPKFKHACAYHIPEKWADDVEEFINQVQIELEGQITFKQIKEKFCQFTVYFEYTDNDAITRMNELIHECIDRLINKGVHPPMTGEKE